MFSEDVVKSNCSDSSTESESDELSESELPSVETTVEGFYKRAGKDPEVAKLKRELEALELYNKKKKSVIIAQVDKVTDSSEQDTRSFKWTQPVVFDVGSSSTLSSLEKDEEEKKQRKEQRRKFSFKKMIVPVPRQPGLEVVVEPPMPERFRAIVERRNGLDITFVIQKTLTRTDLFHQNNRLSLPKKQMKTDSFLSNEEKAILEAKGNNGIEVLLVAPCEKSVSVKFTKWRMGSTFVYNITGTWFKEVVDDADNRLEIGKMARLWSFRNMLSRLCFVLDCD